MKFLVNAYLVLSLIFMGAVYAHAQETETATTSEDAMSEVSEDSMATTTDEMATGTTTEDNLITDEELEVILEENDALEESDIDDITDLEGEIIAVTEDEIIIEQEDGEIIVVNRDVYQEKVPHSGGIAIGGYIGRKVQSGTINTTGAESVITSQGQTYTVTSSTPVMRNGVSKELSDITDGENVMIVIDEGGDVIAVEIITDEEAGSIIMTTVIWVAAIVVLLFIFGIFRKKRKPGSVSAQQ